MGFSNLPRPSSRPEQGLGSFLKKLQGRTEFSCSSLDLNNYNIVGTHMDDNLIHKVKSKYYEIIDFPGTSKGLNPLHHSMSISGASLLTLNINMNI